MPIVRSYKNPVIKARRICSKLKSALLDDQIRKTIRMMNDRKM